MTETGASLDIAAALPLTDQFVRLARATQSPRDLMQLLGDVTCEMAFRHFAMIHHADLSMARSDRVDYRHYPAAISDRLFLQDKYRRDPIIRACLFAESAFLWSDLHHFIRLDSKDRSSFEFGAREGLNEGITVPCVLVGDNDAAGQKSFVDKKRYFEASQNILNRQIAAEANWTADAVRQRQERLVQMGLSVFRL